MKTPILAPSLLSSDFSELGEAIHIIEKNGGSWVHIDVMDGTFVPEITIGQPVVRSLRPLTTLPFDVHLMVVNPERQVESFALAGADSITFHYEAATTEGAGSEAAVKSAAATIEKIHSLGKKAGISIKPETPVSVLEDLLPLVEIVLVMTVRPGFGGQKIIPECVRKVEELVEIRRKRNLGYILSVDGGVNEKTVEDVLRAGTDVVVSGSCFFAGKLTGQDIMTR